MDVIEPSNKQPQRQPLNWKDWLLIIVMAFIMTLPGITAIPVLDRNEAIIATASQAMITGGDVFATAAHMPAGLHWAQSMIAYIAGYDPTNIVAYRLPSLAAGLAMALILGWIGAHMFSRRVGRVAALVLIATLGFGLVTRMATGNAMAMSANLLAMAALARLYFRTTETWHAPLAPYVFWLGLIGGLMVKGSSALIVPLLTMVCLIGFDRSFLRFRALFHWKVLILPAVLLIAHTAPVLFGDAQWTSLQGMGPPKTGFSGQHTAFGLLLLWPMLFIALLGLPLFWTRRRDPRFRFLAFWLIPSLLFFELAPQSGGLVALPLAGSLIIASAVAFIQFVDDRPSRFHRWPHYTGVAVAGVSAIIGIGLGLYPVWAANNLPGGLNIITNPALGMVLIGGAGLVAYTSWRGFQDWSGPRTMLSLLAGSFILLGLSFGSLLPALSPLWISERSAKLINANLPRSCMGNSVAVVGFDEPSLIFTAGERVFAADSTAAAEHLLAMDSCHLALVNAEDSTDFYNALGDVALRAEPLGAIAGYNYAANQNVSLGLFRLSPTYQVPQAVMPELFAPEDQAPAPDPIEPDAETQAQQPQSQPLPDDQRGLATPQ